MADDRYNWLDNDAAERLLRGEPVGTTADGARELALLLEGAAPAEPAAGPLPGEESAVAAFRRAHPAAPSRPVARAGLARPFRRGFAVALAACALGGVAVAAGTGVLPSPFRPGPDPASSVSTDVSPGTLETPDPGTTAPGSPDATAGERPTDDATVSPTPDASHTTTTPPPSATTRAPGRGVPGVPGNGNGKNGSADRREVVLALCRDYEAGKRGDMDRDTLQRLERAAGGPAKIHAFCRRYLQQQGNGNGNGGGDGKGDGGGNGDGNGNGDGGAGGGQGGGHGGDDDGDGQPSTAPEPPESGDPDPVPTSPEPSDTVTPTPTTSTDDTAPAPV
ncbi:hypothetical protein [Streptomyces catenulae]|uniref:Extensin n=1 Tax=Streptomyces catenulae TaxID=66875 RepID=A0ABV2YU10_9ACTN|nr:hypothetical protein [Streptomyces catenulae]